MITSSVCRQQVLNVLVTQQASWLVLTTFQTYDEVSTLGQCPVCIGGSYCGIHIFELY
jgi:hypothetical protein